MRDWRARIGVRDWHVRRVGSRGAGICDARLRIFERRFWVGAMGVGLAGVLRRRYLRFFGRTLTLVPVLVGLFLFYMLGFSAQVFEVYLIVLEGDRWAGVCGLAGIVVLCLLLHAWHYEFATLSMDRDYPEHADPFLDRMLCRVRNTKAIVIAMLPCLGAIFGLWQTRAWFAVRRRGTARSASCSPAMTPRSPCSPRQRSMCADKPMRSQPCLWCCSSHWLWSPCWWRSRGGVSRCADCSTAPGGWRGCTCFSPGSCPGG